MYSQSQGGSDAAGATPWRLSGLPAALLPCPVFLSHPPPPQAGTPVHFMSVSVLSCHTPCDVDCTLVKGVCDPCCDGPMWSPAPSHLSAWDPERALGWGTRSGLDTAAWSAKGLSACWTRPVPFSPGQPIGPAFLCVST